MIVWLIDYAIEVGCGFYVSQKVGIGLRDPDFQHAGEEQFSHSNHKTEVEARICHAQDPASQCKDEAEYPPCIFRQQDYVCAA